MTRKFTRFLRRNSIALLALFFALGGTTYAASTALVPKNSVGSAQVINRSLQTKDLSGKARKALKGNRGLTGAKGDKGDKGATGASGPAGTAVAYARVLANGTVDAAQSKGIVQANVSHPATGFYCFSGLSFTPTMRWSARSSSSVRPEPSSTTDRVTGRAPGRRRCPSPFTPMAVQVATRPTMVQFMIAIN